MAGWDLIVEIPRRVLEWAAPERLCFPAVIEAASLQPGTRLLDVGCGSGRLLEMAAFAEPGSLLTGVDSDDDSLELARNLTRNSPTEVDIRRARAEALPFTTGYFDVVSCTLLLGELGAADRAAALDECVRVLRPGGTLVIADWRPLTCLPVSAARALATPLGLWPFARPDAAADGDDSGPLDWVRAADLDEPCRVRGYRAVIGYVELVVARAPQPAPRQRPTPIG